MIFHSRHSLFSKDIDVTKSSDEQLTVSFNHHAACSKDVIDVLKRFKLDSAVSNTHQSVSLFVDCDRIYQIELCMEALHAARLIDADTLQSVIQQCGSLGEADNYVPERMVV